uniref:Integrase core domain-containing protein n=1 Tax=Candidatus Kentrum sp. LFY TaxID=2126342 RepID=A0A450WGW0_9GAMM|nr:MAG: Integrase core domain-containing protein [Candidatus Kentron sp. LFY]
MSPALTERLVTIAQAAREIPHGGRTAFYETESRKIGISRQTLLRKLKEVTMRPKRKRRTDAGVHCLSREEALVIASLIAEARRKNPKRMLSLVDAIAMARKNDLIGGVRFDRDTGEIFGDLSDSAIARSLHHYGLHKKQLGVPDPVTRLRSEGPNHVWQLDASVCTLHYLENGLKGTDPAVHYKNKPQNLARIARNRVIRYAITDHASGWIYVEYVLGAESGENLLTVFIHAMQPRHHKNRHDVLHGVPRILMMDKGAANTAVATKNLCHALGVRVIPHEKGNPRANGQVEGAQNIIETKFEMGLRFQEVKDLDELNELARRWRAGFGARAIHGRHGLTRNAAWSRIASSALILAPPETECRALAVSHPESRRVQEDLTVSFRGELYDVSTVPDVRVGERLFVARNVFRKDAAHVVLIGEDGREVYHVVERVGKGELGYPSNAAMIGEEYRRHEESPAQKARKEIERCVTEEEKEADVERARKEKRLPFGGKVDPMAHLSTKGLPTPLPRTGTAHSSKTPEVVMPRLSHMDMAIRFREILGDDWTSERYLWLQKRFPDGVREDRFDAIVQEIRGGAKRARERPNLKVVG